MLRTVRSLTMIGIAWVLQACGGSAGYVIESKPPEPPKPVAEAPKTPDAWRDHRGEHVALGKKFRLAAKPVAVDGPNFVVSLLKVDWSTMTTPSGKEVKEGAAQLSVTQGEETSTALVPQGDSKRLFGVKLEVVAAGEEYNKARLVYEPWVELVVKAEE